MKNRLKRIVFLIVFIPFILSINVYAQEEEPKEVGFVEKSFIATINSIASAIDIEDFSIDHLIYGKSNGNARPSTWTKSKYSFNAVNGNIFFDIYRGSYGVFRHLGIILINIYVVYLATRGLCLDATSKDYFKSGILTLISTTLLFTSLPGILDFVLMIREYLLDFVYAVSAGLSGTVGGGFIEGLRENASSSTATLKDSLFYFAGVILNIYFLFIYISMGIAFVLSMWLSPILITTSEKKLKEKINFFKYTAGIIITPVIDAALLIMPLVVVSKSEGVLVAIATFAAIIPTRTWIRRQLGLGTGVSEMMGMGFALMGTRMFGSTVGGLVGAGHKFSQGFEHSQKSLAFDRLSKSDSFSDGLSQANESGKLGNEQAVYGSMNSFSQGQGLGSFKSSAQGSFSSPNKVNINREQTAEEAKLVAKYGHKDWFKETGIQMTNEQKKKAEAAKAMNAFTGATLGLAGRYAGSTAGSIIGSGYGVGGVAVGIQTGGDIGDAVGDKVGSSLFKAAYSTSSDGLNEYTVNPENYQLTNISKDMSTWKGDKAMIENSKVPVVGSGGVSRSNSEDSVKEMLVSGFNDFKVQNETILRADYDSSVPKYANAVIDSNKDVLLNSAVESFVNINSVNKDSKAFNPDVMNKAHEVAKQQVVTGLVSGEHNEQFRDTFAKQIHSQEVSKVVTGETKIKAENMASKQLDQFSEQINGYIEGHYRETVISYVQDYINNENNGD